MRTRRGVPLVRAELEKRIRPNLRMSIGFWRVDETYVKVKRARTIALRRWQAAAGITEGALFRRIWTPPRGGDGRNTPPAPPRRHAR